ncbi:hypothetical protein TUM4644_23890 [Shewanella colwelliana]|nr:hypothetical protein TUM4644_23890 [Shewanella colwelliana]
MLLRLIFRKQSMDLQPVQTLKWQWLVQKQVEFYKKRSSFNPFDVYSSWLLVWTAESLQLFCCSFISAFDEPSKKHNQKESEKDETQGYQGVQLHDEKYYSLMKYDSWDFFVTTHTLTDCGLPEVDNGLHCGFIYY